MWAIAGTGPHRCDLSSQVPTMRPLYSAFRTPHSALRLALLRAGGLYFEHLAATVRAAIGAHMVRQARAVTLGALNKLHRLKVLLATAIPTVLARYSLFGCSTHGSFLLWFT